MLIHNQRPLDSNLKLPAFGIQGQPFKTFIGLPAYLILCKFGYRTLMRLLHLKF